MNKLKWRKLLRVFLLFLIFVLGGYAILSTIFDEDVIQKGDVAPNFTAINLEGDTVSLDDFRGKGVILNFWASWCDPCKREMPRIDDAYNAGIIDNVEFLAINYKEAKITVDTFARQYEINFPILMDPDGTLSDRYNVFNLPATFVIDKDGKIVDRVVGELPSKEFILSLMAKVH